MIKKAETAGFCYGVKRAVDAVYEMAQRGEKIATLGNLIHNRQVVEDLAGKGVNAYDRPEDIPAGVKAVIRTHGVGREIEETLAKRPEGYYDMTCPFVAKIHNIVKKHSEDGWEIVIVGDKDHPEVKGINGWCQNKGHIIYGENADIDEKIKEKPLCIVAQTTINRKIFVQIVENLKKTCKTYVIFDTICNATGNRQSEVRSLASECDMIVVVGGRESSNTRKLAEIARECCGEVYHIETFEDLPQNIYYKNKKIGITAGASTPSRIIEEVVNVMEENLKNGETFAELFEQYSSKTLNNGDIVDGTVVEVRNNEVIVDISGFKYNGQLAADQISDDPTVKPQDMFNPGDAIKVYVIGVNDAEGKVVLSKKKLAAMESWNKMKAAYESGETVEGKIIKAVKGGVIALTDGSQVFIPARQASERYVQDLQTLVGNEVAYKITEIDERRKRVVGSVRVILEAARKEREAAFWADVEVGKRYQGVVKSLTSFGAFVDIGGVDGLVHISELSWTKIKHPSEVVKEGDLLDVYIKDVNKETKKISLGFKKAEDNPWVIAENKYHVGDVVKVKIVRMLPFGAFAELMPTIDGLIHISQIADRRIGKPEDVLQIGQEVNAKILELNWADRKISLSIRALLEEGKSAEPEEEEPADENVLVYSTDPEVEVENPIEIEE